MKISEAAKLTGLNVSSIRFYERKGLLMPQREDGSKYRDYTDEDVQRIRQILLYRKMGISVETIELILKGKAVPGEILAEQKRVLEEQITELKGASELCKLVMKEAEIPENKKLEEYAAPCGVCRQVMMEFCDSEEFQIILATSEEQYEIFTLKELLPLGFGPKNLKK